MMCVARNAARLGDFVLSSAPSLDTFMRFSSIVVVGQSASLWSAPERNAMSDELTHAGMIRYEGARDLLVELRETKVYWINHVGTRFRKSDGRMPGGKFPDVQLRLNTITSIAEAKLLPFTRYLEMSVAASGYDPNRRECVNVREWGDLITTLALATQTTYGVLDAEFVIRKTAAALKKRLKGKRALQVIKKIIHHPDPCYYLGYLWDLLLRTEAEMKQRMEAEFDLEKNECRAAA